MGFVYKTPFLPSPSPAVFVVVVVVVVAVVVPLLGPLPRYDMHGTSPQHFHMRRSNSSHRPHVGGSSLHGGELLHRKMAMCSIPLAVISLATKAGNRITYESCC